MAALTEPAGRHPPDAIPYDSTLTERCQYIRISVILSPFVSHEDRPRASTHFPGPATAEDAHLNSVENHGPAAKISPELRGDFRLVCGARLPSSALTASPRIGSEKGFPRKPRSEGEDGHHLVDLGSTPCFAKLINQLAPQGSE